MKQISTGVPGMDVLLNGGIPYRRTVLLSGSCGTGKTTFCAQFIREGVKKNEPGLYISFEEDEDKLKEDLYEMGIHIDELKKTGKFRLIGGPIGKVKRAQLKTKATADDIIDEIREVVSEMKAKRVVLDSVNLFTMLLDNDVERRDALARLSSLLSNMGCTTIMTCEVEEGSKKLSRYGFEEFAVDGVIMLYRIPFDNTFERAVAVIKMRGIDHSKSIRSITISKEGMKVYPNQEPYHKINYLL
ncbi:hypothetical protein D6764_01625 [Candidatus Woesearchaeota archaeon]|nr:MAG: hypothetical protein D6764_01625 [Candidatus Woesearchaeota archaeon]